MSANEKVWVRYTTDKWATSTTVEASSNQGGNKWRATIPKSSNIFDYYAYTTIQQASAPAEADADFFAISYATNNGDNYSINLVNKLNYVMSNSTITWEYLSGASAFKWNGTADEGYSDATNIGFNFYYCGTEFTQFQVSTNGFLRFGSDLSASTPTDALSGTLRRILAPLWDDLTVADLSTDITYKLTGSAPNRILTVEWKNVKWNKTAATANAEFQIKLYENGNKVEFIYGDFGTPTLGAASIGLADITAITSTTNFTTGAFLSINVGGTSGARVFHQSMNYPFFAISQAPDDFTKFTFTPISPTPISAGTYTIGGTSPTFISFSEAAVNINVRGIAGAVVLNARDGTYDDIFHINDSLGTSETNTLTLQKESGTVILIPRSGSGNSTTGALGSSDCIIRLCGSQYVTIQNLNLEDNGQASTILKFEIGVGLATSVAPNGSMRNGGRFNTFKNLNINMKPTTGANHAGSICIRYFTTSSTETDTSKGTSYNVIEGCTLTGFWRAAWKNFGISGTNPDRGNVIKNCTIGNVSITTGTGSDIRALEIDCQSNILIENNIIENIEATIMTTNNIYGMWFNPASSTTNLNSGTNVIRNNIIRNLENSGAGTTSGFAVGIACNNVANNTEMQIYGNKIYDLYSNGSTTSRAYGIGMFMSTGTPTTVKIYNNMIYDLRCPRSTSTPGARGIDCQNAAGNGLFQVYNNTVYLDDAVPPTNAGHQSACVYWANFGTATLDLRNNILVNTMSTSTGKAVCLYPSANSNYLRLASTTDNNLYHFGTGTNQGLSWDAATLRTTLAAHQAAIVSGGLGGPRDVNAIAANIISGFVSGSSPYDLHISSTNWIPFGQGQPTALVTTDIDGDARSTAIANGPVCIGADEYTATGSATTTVDNPTPGNGVTQTFTGVDGKPVAVISWSDNGPAPTYPSSITFTPGKRPVNNSGNTINHEIYRMFTITPNVAGSDWQATVRLYYNASTELRGYIESSLRVNRRPDVGDGPWTVILPTTIDTTFHYGEFTTTSFSTFSFDDGSNPLPVELIKFVSSVTKNGVILNWATSTEINNYGFEIERSVDQKFWEKIGFVQGSGNSNSPKEYSFIDDKPLIGKISYRLKQIDIDGSFSYSDIIIVETELTSVPKEYSLSQNYPNPFNPVTKISYTLPKDSDVRLLVYSINGELVMELVNQKQSAGTYNVVFDASNLASGTYIYRLIANDFVQTKKMLLVK